MSFKVFTFLFFVLLCANTSAQSLAEELTATNNIPLVDDLFTEKIAIISNSKKIFILTNENQKLRKGDFISLVIDDDLATRAVVAKVTPNRVGIKMLRIYSLTRWQKLRTGLDVQIIRGDDSYFKKAQETEVAKDDKESSVIQSESDLFNDTGLETNEELGKNRIIRPDNIIGMGYSQLAAQDTNGRDKRFNRVSFSWAKQFKDNYWIEGVYSYINLPTFPSPEVERSVAHEFIAKLKYNIKAPAYTFVMPYFGFLKRFVNAPAVDQGGLQSEIDKVNDLENLQIAIGATFLRRLVPGWFLTANLGTDMINVGVAVEF